MPRGLKRNPDSCGGDFKSSDCVKCTKSEVSYDSLPFQQVAIEKSYTVYLGPKAALNDEAPLQFDISGSGEDYWDPSEMFLKLKGKIVKADAAKSAVNHGGPTPSTVGVVNDIANAMFSQIDVVLNDTVISQSSNMYGYKCYLSNLLSYTPEVKNAQMYMQGWERDTPEKFSLVTNEGYVSRRKRFENSNEFEVKVRLHTDLTFQNRLIPNHVTARLTLTRAKNAFCLLAFDGGDNPPQYSINLTYANLQVRKVQLAPDHQLMIEQKILGGQGAHFPITHTVMKNYTIPEGYSTHEIDGLFMGQRPYAITIGFVKNTAFTGTLTLNPFEFKHYDLNYLSLNVDGTPVPSQPLQPNYEMKHYTECYETLFKGTCMLGSDVTHGISYGDYTGGYCLYCFNLTPDNSDGTSHISQRKTGNVRLSIKWAKPLPETVTLIVLGQLQNTITIDKTRNVLFDYAT